jgi:tetrahydromethanopterin S-methyltransferase subunit H
VPKNTDGPFSIDGATADVRIAGAKYVGNTGLSNRVVYNSITPHTTDEEVRAIKEAKIRSAILLTLKY